MTKSIYRNVFVALFALVLAFFALSHAGAKRNIITGTFSSLRYIEEAGDLLGEELRIVYTRKGYVGILQIAEGEPSEIMVFPINVDGNKVTFVFKGEAMYSGSFEGEVSASEIKGHMKWGTDTKEHEFSLPRKSSFWD